MTNRMEHCTTIYDSSWLDGESTVKHNYEPYPKGS
jgi:hypothetical protein